MKMTIQKSVTFTINTGQERKRINMYFKSRPECKKKLLKLMDLVEAEKWEEAKKELEGQWWSGYDYELECPRLEFVGMLHAKGDGDPWATYADLIWQIVENPEIYKVIHTETKPTKILRDIH